TRRKRTTRSWWWRAGWDSLDERADAQAAGPVHRRVEGVPQWRRGSRAAARVRTRPHGARRRTGGSGNGGAPPSGDDAGPPAGGDVRLTPHVRRRARGDRGGGAVHLREPLAVR